MLINVTNGMLIGPSLADMVHCLVKFLPSVRSVSIGLADEPRCSEIENERTVAAGDSRIDKMCSIMQLARGLYYKTLLRP